MSSAEVETVLSIMQKVKSSVKNQAASKGVNGQTETKRYVSAKRKGKK